MAAVYRPTLAAVVGLVARPAMAMLVQMVAQAAVVRVGLVTRARAVLAVQGRLLDRPGLEVTAMNGPQLEITVGPLVQEAVAVAARQEPQGRAEVTALAAALH